MPLGNRDMKTETTDSTAVSENILGHFDKICTISSKHLTNSITKNMQIANVIHVMLQTLRFIVTSISKPVGY